MPEVFDQVGVATEGKRLAPPADAAEALHVAEGVKFAVQGGRIRVLGLEDPDPTLIVVGRIEQDALRGVAVAAGTADLLVVNVQRGGHPVVNHETDVGFVDAHAKSDGGDDDPRSVIADRSPGVHAGGIPARPA